MILAGRSHDPPPNNSCHKEVLRKILFGGFPLNPTKQGCTHKIPVGPLDLAIDCGLLENVCHGTG